MVFRGASRAGEALVRVTGGDLAGRRLQRPPPGVRPSGDRLRESLFARLASCEGLRVLDLYAGTGTLGIEALSRGATRVVFVEWAAPSLAALRANLQALDLEGRTRVVGGEVKVALRRLGRASQQFDLVLLDPPYSAEAAEPALRGLLEAALLSAQSVVILERSRHHPVAEIRGLVRGDEQRYGDSVISWFRPSGSRVSPKDVERKGSDSEVK